MTDRELLIAEDFLGQCMAWQELIDAQNSTHKMDQAGLEAKARITPPAETASMLVHAERALVAASDSPQAEKTSTDALIFGEVIARGAVNRIDYLRFANQGILAWTVQSPEIKNARDVRATDALAENDDQGEVVSAPIGRELYMPMYFPVSGIRSAIFAGRNSYRLSPRFYYDSPLC